MSQERKPRVSQKLDDIERFVNWETLGRDLEVIDKSGGKKGGRPRYPLVKMLKMVFLYHGHFRWSQHLYNLSDPELEDQLLDRRSFRAFVGIDSDEEVPDYSTVWVFKDKLMEHEVLDTLFERIIAQLENKQLILKKGTIVDATIVQSSNRPLSNKKRAELETKRQGETSVSQLDLDAAYFSAFEPRMGLPQLDIGGEFLRCIFQPKPSQQWLLRKFCGQAVTQFTSVNTTLPYLVKIRTSLERPSTSAATRASVVRATRVGTPATS